MRRMRVRLLVLALVAVAGVGLLAAASLSDSLVYYRTPSELAGDEPASDGVIRLGGLVEAGSIVRDGEGVRFVLTDGVAETHVWHDGEVRGVFQEGQGALVEGRMGLDGVFRSELLMVQHDNEYRAIDELAEEEGYER